MSSEPGRAAPSTPCSADTHATLLVVAQRGAGKLEEAPMRYFSDAQRHLVCWPYSVEGLHQMAAVLGIHRCWFHAGRLAHYDVPKKRIAEIALKTEVVSGREILNIIKGKNHVP